MLGAICAGVMHYGHVPSIYRAKYAALLFVTCDVMTWAALSEAVCAGHARVLTR